MWMRWWWQLNHSDCRSPISNVSVSSLFLAALCLAIFSLADLFSLWRFIRLIYTHIFLYIKMTHHSTKSKHFSISRFWSDKNDGATKMMKRTRSAIIERMCAYKCTSTSTRYTNDVTILYNMDSRACFDNAPFFPFKWRIKRRKEEEREKNIVRLYDFMFFFWSVTNVLTARSSCRIVFRLSFCSLSS